jgi:hypothetical protein
MCEQPAEVVVELLHEPHVGGHDVAAHRAVGEVAARRLRLEAPHHRMSLRALSVVAHARRHVIAAVQPVVRVRHHVRPVRLDVRKMQAPGSVAAAFDEFDAAAVM